MIQNLWKGEGSLLQHFTVNNSEFGQKWWDVLFEESKNADYCELNSAISDPFLVGLIIGILIQCKPYGKPNG